MKEVSKPETPCLEWCRCLCGNLNRAHLMLQCRFTADPNAHTFGCDNRPNAPKAEAPRCLFGCNWPGHITSNGPYAHAPGCPKAEAPAGDTPCALCGGPSGFAFAPPRPVLCVACRVKTTAEAPPAPKRKCDCFSAEKRLGRCVCADKRPGEPEFWDCDKCGERLRRLYKLGHAYAPFGKYHGGFGSEAGLLPNEPGFSCNVKKPAPPAPKHAHERSGRTMTIQNETWGSQPANVSEPGHDPEYCACEPGTYCFAHRPSPDAAEAAEPYVDPRSREAADALIAKLKAQNVALQEAHDHAQTGLKSARKQERGMRKKIAELTARVQAAERDSSASMDLYRAAIARRDDAEAKITALTAELERLRVQWEKHQEDEAANCPEDQSCVETIKALRSELERLRDLIVRYSSTSFVGGSMQDEALAIRAAREAGES